MDDLLSTHTTHPTFRDTDRSPLEREGEQRERNDAKKQRKPRRVRVDTSNKYEGSKIPVLRNNDSPTLHSDTLKPGKLSQQQEVFLAVMDANLNEIDEGEKDIPSLRDAWIDSAADILMGAPKSFTTT